MSTRKRTTTEAPAARIRELLDGWYREHGRHTLPWRLTRDTYAVLVSEVMLQQTQVERVTPRYARWLERWPTAAALAAESPSEVIREWGGLGYNRRALHLHGAARGLASMNGAGRPGIADLRTLPGVGAYTAAAVACFAGEERVAVVDTNIGRVIARAMLGKASGRQVPPRNLTNAAEALLPAARARDHNLALMDLGAMVCVARSPACEACPLARECAWLAAGKPADEAWIATTPPFETTARFARGRIVDALREVRALSEAEVRALLPAGHRVSAAGYLQGLERDGLVEHRDGRWGLAGTFTAG
ncbi:MAG: A/G-specific adenine glycosylase [Chloroflexi bacterium]|nr:A/G-specific adenine glycosylase [Chloroflexota bacterium]